MSSTETITENHFPALVELLAVHGFREVSSQSVDSVARLVKFRRHPLRPAGLEWVLEDLPPEVIRYTISGGMVRPMGTDALAMLQFFASTSKAIRKLRNQQARRDRARKRTAA